MTGKNVPEKRYNGMTTHLKRLPTTFGLDTVAAPWVHSVYTEATRVPMPVLRSPSVGAHDMV